MITNSNTIRVYFQSFDMNRVLRDGGEIMDMKSEEDGKSDIRGFSLTEFCSSREADKVGH